MKGGRCLLICTLAVNAAFALHDHDRQAEERRCMRPRQGYDEGLLCSSTDRRLVAAANDVATAPTGTNLTALEMYVRPTFEMWSGLDFAHGFASGIFAVEQMWPTSTETYFSSTDAADIVRLGNFNGGNNGLVSQPIIQLAGPAKDGSKDSFEVRRQFEGRFKQSFDATCFPFDHQTVYFNITMDKPASLYWEMFMMCAEGFTGKDKDGNEVSMTPGKKPKNIHSCTKTLDTTSVGFGWPEMICTKESSSLMSCSMVGARSNTRIFVNFLMPSIMITMMSYASFLMHVSMAMPRVATTMIAMLTLINLRNALSHSLPGSGSLSWMEKYFMFTGVFLFLNLCAHVAAMGLHKRGYILASDFIDDIGCGAGIAMSIILPFLLLLGAGCTDEGISGGSAATVIVFGFLLLIAVTIKAVFTKKDAIKAWRGVLPKDTSVHPLADGQ